MPSDPASAVEVHEPREHPLSEFFDGLRTTRREERAPAGTRQRAAMLTIVRDESLFFPIWLGYYSRFFEPEDIHFLYQGSTDGSTDVGCFVRIPFEHETIYNTCMLETLDTHQRRLLESYDVVVMADVDEIIAPDPDWGTLGDYVAGFREEFVNCLGYEVLHLPDREPALDPARPVLEQRGFWFAAEGYDKPLVTTAPLSWEVGRHSRVDGKLNVDPDLRLIHLHRIDHDRCFERHRVAALERAWAETDLESGFGSHNRIAGAEEFERWYYTAGCFGGPGELLIERIPERWRGLI